MNSGEPDDLVHFHDEASAKTASDMEAISAPLSSQPHKLLFHVPKRPSVYVRAK